MLTIRHGNVLFAHTTRFSTDGVPEAVSPLCTSRPSPTLPAQADACAGDPRPDLTCSLPGWRRACMRFIVAQVHTTPGKQRRRWDSSPALSRLFVPASIPSPASPPPL